MVTAALVAAALLPTACGGTSTDPGSTDGPTVDGGTAPGEQAVELSGWVRDPLPDVGDLTLPDVSRDGEPFAFRARPGGLLLVYFGFASCPDICPLSLSNVAQVFDDLGPDAASVDLAVVTVDPGRDTIELLPRYVASFVPGGHALRTDDNGELRAVADVFGADYLVEIDEDGRIEVGHTAHLYAVDDQGRLLVTWPFGTTPDALVAELRLLLHEGMPTT